jgi:hypothetical protein
VNYSITNHSIASFSIHFKLVLGVGVAIVLVNQYAYLWPALYPLIMSNLSP